MFNFLAVVLKAILWLFGIGRKKTAAERHEETAKELGKLEVENNDLKDALEQSEKARQTERKMNDIAKREPATRRKAKAGDKIFFFLFIAVVAGVSGIGCYHHCPPPKNPAAVPPIARPPQIPLIPPPKLPPVTIPEPNEFNQYCFSQEEMDKIVQGIDELKLYGDKLRKTIEIYNADAERSK